ncbi:MAG: outer membrane protein assembly factor BamA [Bdellovibrionales bacterium]|nr:outer membrane protein assembly factor BamA [Bdellovibrionales bacterium]
MIPIRLAAVFTIAAGLLLSTVSVRAEDPPSPQTGTGQAVRGPGKGVAPINRPLPSGRRSPLPTRTSPPSAISPNVKKTKRGKPYVAKSGGVKIDDSVDGFAGLPVRGIEVKGLKRIERDAVLGKLTTKPGVAIDREMIRADVQALFNMGYFDDIEVSAERDPAGANLTVTVRERPVITEIQFEGNERITTTDLEAVIKVKQWSILDVNKVKEDIGFITKAYEDKGYYLAKTTFEVTQPDPKKPDEVVLRYKVNDFDKVQIKKITFLNNKAFSDDMLKNVLGETREGGAFSFMSNSGNFKESAFKNDLQRLVYFYLDNGYVKFKYESPVVTISDDKKWLYITIFVDEGEKYNTGTIDFSGDLLFGREELGNDVQMKQSVPFSISKRNADIQKLSEKYQDLGYAFVNVIPKMDIKDDTKTVDIDYHFEKGNLAYFGEINVLGNSKTHDKVIRRELKIKEGELYNGTRFRLSKENVERLGYFQPGEVLFNTSTPKDHNDVVNVDIQVKERPTGTITLGAGYGSSKGLFFQTQISESNFLGRGQTISLSTNITRDRRDKSINLGFSDPYIFDTNFSAGFDLYYVTFFIPDKYTTRKFGGDVRLGHPVGEYTNAYLTYKRERLTIESIEIDNPDVNDYFDIDQDTGTLSSLVWSLIRDRRNNRFETSGGSYQSLSLETAGVAGLGGDKRFVKAIANNRYYTRVVGDLIFRNSTEYGEAHGQDGKGVPPSERFYLGGPNNLKGYNFYTVGPSRDKLSSTGLPYVIPEGGKYEFYSLFELEHPIVKDAGLKFVVFYDIGNVWTDRPDLGNFKLRSDTGFGFRWFSPIGPLRFEWGFPINKGPNDDNSVFQFFIGPPF